MYVVSKERSTSMHVYHILLVTQAVLVVASGELMYPPKWKDVPGSMEGFRVGDRYVIDPWKYHQRLGLYKILIEETSAAFRPFGANNSGNILWGLPLQFGWQFSSGRTHDLTNSSTCGFPSYPDCVSTNNWWSSMNYYLSVIPFLGMVKSGFLPISPTNITINSPLSGADLYCTSVITCDSIDSELISRWAILFRLLKNATVTSNLQIASTLSRYQFLSAMWRAHVNSVTVAFRLFEDKLPLMSEEEKAFGENWANLVTFIAPTLFVTDNENTAKNQIMYLPGRLLWNTDHAPNAPGLSTNQNKALVVLSMFNRVNKLTGGVLLSMWERAMCSPGTRAVGREILENIVINPFASLLKIFRLIRVAVNTC